MLPNRSIYLQFFLLFLISVNCQEYDANYEEGEPASFEEADHPDYSKYYSTDTSAPLTAGATDGFTSPIEFSGFFGPDFGESKQTVEKKPSNPFVQESKPTGFVASGSDFGSAFFTDANAHYPKDYFEVAQQKDQQLKQQAQNKENGYDLPPGPNYISSQLPTIQEAADFSTDVEHVKPHSTHRDKYRKDYEESDENEKDFESQKKEKPSKDKYKKDYQTAGEDVDYENPKFTDYSVGKSSSTVSQSPNKLKKLSGPTPYQKYSFQPLNDRFDLKSKYLDELISTVAPFNPNYQKVVSTPSTLLFEGAPSEVVSSQLKGKNCKKITKNLESTDEETGSVKEDPMNCYVCEDPNTQSHYTHCSYSSDPSDTKNDYSGHSVKYSTPSKPHVEGFRYKRYSGDERNTDPYDYVRKRSQKQQADAEDTQEYEEEQNPDYYNVEEAEKSFSEAQSEQLKNSPGNCIKEEKSGMTCTICKDPKTGGNFEQCSYTSAPQEKKYAYVTEKKYDSNDEPEEGSESKSAPLKEAATTESSVETTEVAPQKQNFEQETESGDKTGFDAKKLDGYNEHKRKHTARRRPKKPKAQKVRKQEQFEDESKPETETEYFYKNPEYERSREYVTGQPPRQKAKKLVDDDPYNVPKHFAESTISEKQSDEEERPEAEEEGEEEEDSSKLEPYKEIDEYHFKLFPEFNHEESQQAEVVAQPGETSRHDVEEVLAEFSKKDRSACKKAERNGMTCYLCQDKNGIQHEECMYVSESKPQASHVAYHEVQQVKSPSPPLLVASASELSKRKHFFKKATTPAPFRFDVAASEEVERKIRYKPNKGRKRSQKKASREESEENEEPTQKTPQEFEVGENEGAYSAETRPVYSKLHGVSLPQYMVEKSEFEKEFDAFAGSF